MGGSLDISLTDSGSLQPKISVASPEQLAGSSDDEFSQMILGTRSKPFAGPIFSIDHTYAQFGRQLVLPTYQSTSFYQTLDSSYYDTYVAPKLPHTTVLRYNDTVQVFQPKDVSGPIMNSNFGSATPANIWLPTNYYSFFTPLKSSAGGKFHYGHLARIQTSSFLTSPVIYLNPFTMDESSWESGTVRHWSNDEQYLLLEHTKTSQRAVLYDFCRAKHSTRF